MTELSYAERATAIDAISTKVNEDGTFTSKTWNREKTKSGHPAINIYMSDEKGQFLQATLTVGGFINIKNVVDSVTQEQIDAALQVLQLAAGIEVAPKVHPEFTNVVPFAYLNKPKSETAPKSARIPLARAK